MLLVRVYTYNKSIPGVIDERPESKQIDWLNSSDRIWLTNHMHWAMHNGCAVLVTPAKFESN